MFCLPLLLAFATNADANPRDGGDRKPPDTEEPAPPSRGGDRDPKPKPEPPTTPKPEPTPPAATPGKGGGGKKGNRDGDDKKKKKKKKRGYKIEAMNPLFGTLVYGPKLGSHHKYQGAASKKKPTVVAKKDLPERRVDRKETKFVGLRGGGMFYSLDGEAISEPGAGIAAGFRPFEAVGIQVDLTHHADDFPGATHANTLIGASGELFFFPWNALSPYVHLGVVQNFRGGGGITNIGSVFGPRGGLGLQLGVGKSMAFDIEGTIIGWSNQAPDDGSSPSAGQLTGAMVFHF